MSQVAHFSESKFNSMFVKNDLIFTIVDNCVRTGGVSNSYIPPPSGNYQQQQQGGFGQQPGNFGGQQQQPQQPSNQYSPPQQGGQGGQNGYPSGRPGGQGELKILFTHFSLLCLYTYFE